MNRKLINLINVVTRCVHSNNTSINAYDFCKEVIPSYYGGSVWIDGNVILFSITTT